MTEMGRIAKSSLGKYDTRYLMTNPEREMRRITKIIRKLRLSDEYHEVD